MRIFHDDAIAFIEQHIGGERKRLLRAADDQHIVGRRNDAATTRKITAHLLAQFAQTLRIGIVRLRMRGGVIEFAPPRARELRIRHRQTVLQVVAQPAMLTTRNRAIINGSDASSAFRQRDIRCVAFRRLRLLRIDGTQRRDVAARSDAALDESFRSELLVRSEHGVARQTQLTREHARRGQTRGRGAAPFEDRLLERTRQLQITRSLIVELEKQGGS